MLPQGLGMIKEMFPPKEMAHGVRHVRAGHGPVLGGRPDPGRLADRRRLFGTGWRMIFLINLPLGLVAVARPALRFLPRVEAAQPPRLDLAGVVLAALGRAACWSSRWSRAASSAGPPGPSS